MAASHIGYEIAVSLQSQSILNLSLFRKFEIRSNVGLFGRALRLLSEITYIHYNDNTNNTKALSHRVMAPSTRPSRASELGTKPLSTPR